MKKIGIQSALTALVIFAAAFHSPHTSNPSLNVSKQGTCRYFVYTLTSGSCLSEKSAVNYTIQIAQPAPCPGANRVCWIRVCDQNGDGIVNATDFAILVNTLDVDGDGCVNDDQLENGVTYEEKS